MANLSNFLENTLVDVLFRGQNATINSKTLSWSAAPLYYVALFTTVPTDTGGTEVSGGSYARPGFGTGTPSAAVAMGLAIMKSTQNDNLASTGTGGATSNTNTVTFPAPTANWGSIQGFGIYDALTGGNLLIYGSLATAKTVNSGDAAPSFSPSQMTVTFA